MIIKKMIQWWQSRRLYVIADPSDNSITLSTGLFKHIRKGAKSDDLARVYMFRETSGDNFGFMLNPDFSEPTQMCNIQYNAKYNCIGFETLCPSVGLILFEYGLLANARVKLDVKIEKAVDKTYYQICRPYAKHPR